MPVDTPSPEYEAALPRWQRCRDCFEGSDAVKARATAYLPMLEGHHGSSQKYDAYKTRAVFYNATARTVAGLLGSVFRATPSWTFPATIEDDLEDVPLKHGDPLTFIPFQFIGPTSVTPAIEKSPILDIVDVNLSHYRTSADFEHGAHLTALPTPWVSGVNPELVESFPIGSDTAWVRDTNIALSRERDEAKRTVDETMRKYEGVDPEEFQRLKDAQATLDKKGVKTPADIDQLVQQAVASAVKPMQDQLQTAAEREQEAHARLAQESFTRLVTEQASRAGVRPEALPDVIGRAGQHGFVMQAGQAVVLGEHGVPKASTAHPGESFSLGEWLVGLKRDGGAHLFKLSVGSGDQGLAAHGGVDLRRRAGQ